MNVNDLIEIEQLKYCYEQAYALHRHTEIPDMFVQEADTVFTLPSAGDRTVGWDVINEKFCHELYYVSPNEDSFHTGWQICTPFLWEGEEGEIKGIFPTFGFLVLSMDPTTMKPPYPVLSTLELWQDHFARREGRWRIHYLEAQFLLGQCVWKWNAPEDKMLAVQKKLREIPHPVLNPEGICLDSAAGPGASGRDPIRPYMGVGAGLYGVQFAQSLYTLLWQCGRMDEIPDFVFSNADEVSVWYDEEEICTGQNEVRLFFRKMKEKTLNNGGFFRIDMPATQWIEVSDDGQSAAGHWLTMSRQIDRSESGNQYRVRIGLFSNTFRREGGVWKFVSIRWEKLQDFAPYDETPDMNLENYRKDPAGWLTDLPVLKPVSREEGDGRAEEILVLRNKILSWFHAVNTGKTAADVFPCGTEEVREDLQEMLRDVRYILATSPVFWMDEGLTKAEGFFSVSLLTDTEEDEMTNVRGSVGMTLTRTEYGWEIRRFSWYPYAALDSWKKDGEAALLA